MSFFIKSIKKPEYKDIYGDKRNNSIIHYLSVGADGQVMLFDPSFDGGYYDVVEIPTSHGRLIDEDKLLRKVRNAATKAYTLKLKSDVETVLNAFMDIVKETPTVVGAENRNVNGEEIKHRFDCENCIHKSLCEYNGYAVNPRGKCNYFTNKHYVVKLPCKYGDKVGCIVTFHNGSQTAKTMTVENIAVDFDKQIVIKCNESDELFTWGVSVFQNYNNAVRELIKRRRE